MNTDTCARGETTQRELHSASWQPRQNGVIRGHNMLVFSKETIRATRESRPCDPTHATESGCSDSSVTEDGPHPAPPLKQPCPRLRGHLWMSVPPTLSRCTSACVHPTPRGASGRRTCSRCPVEAGAPGEQTTLSHGLCARAGPRTRSGPWRSLPGAPRLSRGVCAEPLFRGLASVGH